MLNRIIIILILLVFVPFPALSSAMRFDVYDIENGLVQETVRGIIQDNKGFLWIGTEEGLNRFDGFSFQPYRYKSDDPNSLTSDVIIDMVSDENGKLWIGTFGGGVNLFDPETSKAQSIGAEALSSKRIQSLFVDSQQRIWVGSFNVDLIVPTDSGYEFSKFTLPSTASGKVSVTAFAEDSRGRIWVGTEGGGVSIYDVERKEWFTFADLVDDERFIDMHIGALLIDSQDYAWLGTSTDGLYRYNLQTRELTHFVSGSENGTALSDNKVLSLLEDKEGNIWVGTDDGISLYRSEKFIQIRHSDTNSHSLSSNRILSIFEDNGGLLWIGTIRGLNKWNPITDRFNHTLPKVSSKYDHGVITDFAQKDNLDLYIATYGGGVLLRQHNQSDYDQFTTENGLPDNRVMSLLVDDDNGLWVGTRSKGIAYLPQKGEKWQYFVHTESENSLPANGVTDIYQDSRGDIWVATYNGGLSRKVGNGFENFFADAEVEHKLSSNRVMQIHEDLQGYLWLATEDGLNRYDRRNKRFSRYQHNPLDNDSISSDMVWNILEDEVGNFWIATEGNGVNLWLRKDRLSDNPVFKQIDRRDGLISNTIYGFAEDNQGRIWMSSNKGLSRYDPNNKQFEHFDKSHGLQGYEFNTGSVLQGLDGNIYFGGTNGFNQFASDFDPITTTPPNIELLSVSGIGDSSLLTDDKQGVLLNYDDYLVVFDFVALDFAAPEKNQYQYKLQGFDDDWVSVGNLRRATYTNLPAGKYEFMVKASNHNGMWSEPQLLLPIKVRPAPWLTVWAFAAYAGIFSVIILMLIQHQLKKFAAEEAQRKRLEREVAERTKELEQQNKKLVNLNHELEVAYRVDALTGLNNRHFLNAYLGKRLSAIDSAHAGIGKNAQHMLIMILDMDNLKPINDTFGHAAGDAAICHLSRMIQERIPQEFHLIRWGGDEFMLVGEVGDKKDTCDWIDNLYESLRAGNFFYFKQRVKLTCSAGFAFYPFDQDNPRALSWDQVSMVADKALYSAKMHKGNWCGVVGPTREINELYLNELLRCKHVKEVSGLVQIIDV